MERRVYKTAFNNELLLKLRQSCQDSFRANKQLCKRLDVDFDNVEARSNLLKSSFEIIDPSKPKLILAIKINHNKQEFHIKFIYRDRVGRTRAGRKRARNFASYPERSWTQIDEEYEKISSMFREGRDYFEEIHKLATQNDTIAKRYPEWLAYRQQEVERGQLATDTVKCDVGRYNNHLKQMSIDGSGLFIDRTIRSITRPDILKLRKRMLSSKANAKQDGKFYNRGPSVVNGVINNIKTFFEWCEDEEYVEPNTNPVYRIPKEEIEARTRTVPQDTLKNFMEYLINDFRRTSERVRVAIFLLWYLSQRVNEVLQIKWEDITVNSDGQRILWIKNKKSKRKNKHKGDNVWFCYFDETLEKLFASLPKLQGNPYVFWTERARIDGKLYLSSSVLNDAIKKCCYELGIPEFAPHDVKRTLVTNDYYRYGIDAVKLSTGNKSDRVIQDSYVHGIKNNFVDPVLYEELKNHQITRTEDINSADIFRSKPESNVYNIVPRKHTFNVGDNNLRKTSAKYKAKIKKKYGVSPSTYHRRKKEGYYD